MNSQDVKKEDVLYVGDKLEAIFEKQRKLEEKYNPIEKAMGALVPDMPLDLNTFEGQERTRLLIYRIAEELFEAGNTMRNKAWKQSQVPIDADHFWEEVSDAVHFLIQLYIENGKTAEDFIEGYLRKNKVNRFRQESKY